MGRKRPSGERGESNLELLLWCAAALGVAVFAGYIVVAKPWEEKPIKLTPEQQAYVQAVATQQADTYIVAVATQVEADRIAAADAAQSAPPLSAPAQPYVPPQPQPEPVVQQPAAPPPAAPPASAPAPNNPAPPPPAATATATPKPVAPPVPPPPPPPTAAPPPPSNHSPMAMCVGYMMNYSTAGFDECVSFVQGSDYNLSLCIGYIIGSPGAEDGKGACTEVARTAGASLGDCLLGLSGQSHFGRTSCSVYYSTN
jgi:hypothetical protein